MATDFLTFCTKLIFLAIRFTVLVTFLKASSSSSLSSPPSFRFISGWDSWVTLSGFSSRFEAFGLWLCSWSWWSLWSWSSSLSWWWSWKSDWSRSLLMVLRMVFLIFLSSSPCAWWWSVTIFSMHKTNEKLRTTVKNAKGKWGESLDYRKNKIKLKFMEWKYSGAKYFSKFSLA